jgi:hypothetical protein
MKFKVTYKKPGKKPVSPPSSNKNDHNPPSNTHLNPDPLKMRRKRAPRMMERRETMSRAVEMTRKNKKEMMIVTGIRLRSCRDSRRSS